MLTKKVLNNVYCRSRLVYTYCKSFGAGGPHKKSMVYIKAGPAAKAGPVAKAGPSRHFGGSADPFDPPGCAPGLTYFNKTKYRVSQNHPNTVPIMTS